VVLGNPIALVAEPVGEPRQIERVAQRHRSGGGRGDGRQIEDGKRYHAKMFCFVMMPGARLYVVSARAAINPTPKCGRRSMVRRRHERGPDA
jgi:hypothetical protein